MIFKEIDPPTLRSADTQLRSGPWLIVIFRFYYGFWQYRFGRVGETERHHPTFYNPDVIHNKFSELFLLVNRVQKALIPVSENADWSIVKRALEPVFQPWGGMEVPRIDRGGFHRPVRKWFNPREDQP